MPTVTRAEVLEQVSDTLTAYAQHSTNILAVAECLLSRVLRVTRCSKGMMACRHSFRDDGLRVAALEDATPLAFPDWRVDTVLCENDVAEPPATDEGRQHSDYHALVRFRLVSQNTCCGVLIVANSSGLSEQDLRHVLDPLVPGVVSTLLHNTLSLRSAVDAHEFFLATMSHEIRTPLSGVIGMARLLQSGANFTTQQRESVDIIYRCGFQLLEVINDILDYSKMDSGRMQLECVSFSVRAAVDEALDVVCLKAREKHLVLTQDVASSVPPCVMGDRKRFRQILINLLTNAIKFTRRGSVQCRVTVAPDGATLVAEVEDTGVGMEQSDWSRIFHSFVQLKTSALETDERGTGLGLAICKRLLDLMRGTIKVKRSQVNVGTVMEVRLPLQKSDRLDDEAWNKLLVLTEGKTILLLDPQSSRRYQLSETLLRMKVRLLTTSTVQEAQLYARNATLDAALVDQELASEFTALTAAAAVPIPDEITEVAVARSLSAALVAAPPAISPAAAAAPTQPKAGGNVLDLRILVVEDNDYNLKVTVQTLKQLGYGDGNIFVATNGMMAVEKCRAMQFDVVLMDLKMPVMDGFQATKLILEQHGRWRRGQSPPTIIAMTAFVMGSERDQCKKVGMKGFLPKPLIMHELQVMLEVVNKRRVR